MNRTRSIINEPCPISNKRQNVTVSFEKVKDTGSILTDYVKASFDCDNQGCTHLEDKQCPIYKNTLNP